MMRLLREERKRKRFLNSPSKRADRWETRKVCETVGEKRMKLSKALHKAIDVVIERLKKMCEAF